jgi:hypothetical protein
MSSRKRKTVLRTFDSLFKELLNITCVLFSVMVIIFDRLFSENEKSWGILGGHIA